MTNVTKQLVQSGRKIFGLFEHVGNLHQRIGDRRIQNHIDAGNGLGGAGHTEFKLVAGKRERGCAVAVGRSQREV